MYLKDFYVENLETTPNTFLSKFPSEIYVSRIINYWGSIFTLYCRERSVWFVFHPYFLSFFPSSFFVFVFLSVFCLINTNDSQDFSCFSLPPAYKHSLSSSRFLPLLFNRSVFNYQIDS